MDPGLFVPLAAMSAVVLIVAIVFFARIRDKEMQVYQKLQFEEMEHARAMRELEDRLRRARETSSSVLSSDLQPSSERRNSESSR